MKKYEFVFLTRPSLTKEKIKGLAAKLEKEIVKIGGKVEKQEDLGKKPLTYLIKENKEAQFFSWQLSFKDRVDFKLINTFLNREVEVLRYLFLVGPNKGR